MLRAGVSLHASSATSALHSWKEFKDRLSRDTRVIAFSFQIEPHLVLEVSPEATLQEIHEAYRRQAKRFHPDCGGTDWAFRLLAQAYEVLSTARIEQASRNDSATGASSMTEPSFASSRAPKTQSEPRRDDLENASKELKHQVGVEKLWVRYEAEPLWLRQETLHDEHSLSCSLNFKWPDPTIEPVNVEPAEVETMLNQLASVFETMCRKTTVDTSRIRINDDSFTGWLSYSTVERGSAAYRLLHSLLTSHGMTVNQWNREFLIPRTWK